MVALTATQEAVLERAASMSGPAAVKQGTDELLELLGAPATKRFMQRFDDGSELYRLDAAQLLARIREELDAAELVHNFGDNERKPYCGLDFTVEAGPSASWFYNLWELFLKGVVPVPDPYWCERIEVNVFGYPPFRDPKQPDWPSASDRLVWGALNIFRKSLGNPVCGPVSAVLSRRQVGRHALVTPVDSGIKQWAQLERAKFARVVDDQGWRDGWQPLSTPASLAHLLPAHVRFFRAAAGVVGEEEYAHYNLARLVCRLLSRRSYRAPFRHEDALRNNFVEMRYGYLECEPLHAAASPPRRRRVAAASAASLPFRHGAAAGSTRWPGSRSQTVSS